MLKFLGILAVLLTPLPSLTEAECGHRVVPSSRVVNGEDATPNSWPWQISLRLRDYPYSNAYGHFCGGSLIENDLVLTAAHCVKLQPSPALYRVIVGSHYRDGNPTPVQETINVTKVTYHSGFSFATGKHDVALLQLAKPITPSILVNTVCLPKRRRDKISPGTNCTITGWGMTIFGVAVADVLQQAVLPVAAFEECRNRMNPKSRLQVYEKPMLCAGGHGKGGCKGDSGGPLVCEENGKWVLRGVVSWGIPGCLTDYYSVFARVSNYVSWIRTHKTP